MLILSQAEETKTLTKGCESEESKELCNESNSQMVHGTILVREVNPPNMLVLWLYFSKLTVNYELWLINCKKSTFPLWMNPDTL